MVEDDDEYNVEDDDASVDSSNSLGSFDTLDDPDENEE